MKTVALQEVMELKYADRRSIPEIEYHADGACVHIGKISPACRLCFAAQSGGGIQIGQECMCNCPECYYARGRSDVNNERPGHAENILGDFFRRSLDKDWMPLGYAYQSAGETLMYIDKLKPFAPIFRMYEKKHGINIYHHLYTNGLLIDDEMLDTLEYMKIAEIRFHLSASNFSDKVFKAMELTKQRGTITLSVEEPAMPHREETLLSYLGDFNNLDVKHVNIVEVQITQNNKPELDKMYPKGRMYKEHFYHLYDEGMVYKVMREKVKNNYNFSVLDCNSVVENHRHAKNSYLGMDIKTLDGMCADFNFNNPNINTL